ncbi:MAG: hypothetical protein AAB656_04170, partial [Patescibacteria group bacterium]
MRLKKLLIIGSWFVALCFVFLGVQRANAQSTGTEKAAEYGVTFPISELADCEDLSECRTFCEDPVNKEACVAYAKQKGFYKEDEFEPDEALVTRAKSVL